MPKPKDSLFADAPDIVPPALEKNLSIGELLERMGRTCFEARHLARAARLYRRMVADGDVIWLGIAGAGIAGGMGGMVAGLIRAGFIDVVCSTGAQVYHDLHFAYGLPVKAIHPHGDDDRLRAHGDTRIYDIGIRERETLEAQDRIVQDFVRQAHGALAAGREIASWEFNRELGRCVLARAPHPERSFVAAAAACEVPIFWDSLANHSIAMNLVVTDRGGHPVRLSAQKDIFDSAAIAFAAPRTGFVELGGGGPKNFIQQTGPTISQILGLDFEGAERGLQIGTALEREGSLSGCTFSEAVTWGKYRGVDQEKMVQVWGEYSMLFPLIAASVIDACPPRPLRRLAAGLPELARRLDEACRAR
jgi:deoxyhypusine synthase